VSEHCFSVGWGVLPSRRIGRNQNVDSTLVVSLIIALIGAISGILGGFLAGKQQGRQQLELEHRKWLLVREDDLAKEARLAVADLTRKIASGIHEIVWLAWKAKYFPRQLTQKDILKYDAVSTTRPSQGRVWRRVLCERGGRGKHDGHTARYRATDEWRAHLSPCIGWFASRLPVARG